MNKYLLIIMCLTILSCSKQEDTSPQESNNRMSPTNKTEQNQNISSKKPQINQIVFRDAKGNILSESEKDSLLENISGIQALRRLNNNNTEYILFKNFDDLRGFIPDDTIDNLIKEYNLMQSGGRGAVITQRIIDRWKDQKLPEGDLNMLDGSVKSFKDFEDKMLVLNFWYINCGPCIVEMPYLNQLVEKYKNEDIEFLALSFDSIPDIKNFLSRTEFNYNHGSIDQNFMYDFTPVSPGHFIVDKDGIIRDILIGAPRNTEEIYDKLISVIEKNKK